MIDCAEKIFIRIADEIIKQQVSIRDVWQQHIAFADIDGEEYELLSPEGLVAGMEALQIDDLREQEITYLLKVLCKPELENQILMQEFMQIMENFGLYDDPNQQQQQFEGQQDAAGRHEKQLDLSALDEKSVKIMVMLMLFLIENNMTVVEFFEPGIFQQNVKSKNKQQMLDIIKSEDFFDLL